MANYEAIYPGATFLLDPNYNFIGYRVPAGEIGATTSIQTANQLTEINKLLNQGIKNVEISTINPEVFEMIPKETFKEINRLNKLTGAESSVHAPIIDPSGFTEQGWTEENRATVQRQFEDVIKRVHDLDPKGNIPVTIHASGVPGSQMIPGGKDIWARGEEGKKEVYGRMIAVDQESGKPIPLEREKLFMPGGEPAGEMYNPERRLNMANHTKFINAITNLAFYKKEADEILVPAYAQVAGVLAGAQKENRPLTKEEIKEHSGAFSKIERAKLFLDNVESSFRNVYEQAAKYGIKNDEKTKKILSVVNEDWKQKREEMHTKSQTNPFESIIIQSNLLDRSLDMFRQLEDRPPQIYKPIEDFVKEKASKTLGEVAFSSYKKFGETSPIISIENPPYGTAVASGQDLKELVQKTRNEFAKKLVDKEGKSFNEAQRIAERIIGATWDTSHISMIRKQGFRPDKVVEETRTIAPFIKHVHFNDNFGSTHTDLPPGMGSLPMKDILEEIEKAKFKGKRVFEGGNFFQHFQKSPFPYTLGYSGSPLFAGGDVYWNQLGALGNYYSGHGPVNPAIHHSMYGSSFVTLPVELGGEIPGTQSRFSGAPNR